MKITPLPGRRWPKLYKRDANGGIRWWTVEFLGNRVRSRFGVSGGVTQIGAWTVVSGKNIGKRNETTPEEQAELLCQQMWDKQKRMRGFVEQLEDVDAVTDKIPVMLAHTYDKGKTPEWADSGMIIQPKLNGERCRIDRRGMWTRNNKPILSAPHIFEALREFFNKHPGMVLDGELYNHELREKLNRLGSLVRKKKPTAEDLEESRELVRYYIYDVSGTTFGNGWKQSSRLRWINSCGLSDARYSVLVPYVYREKFIPNVVHDLYSFYVSHGYEGAILRNPNGLYTGRRTADLLKYKSWQDAEFPVVRVLEGKGKRAGTAGKIVFRRKHNDEWVEFEANLKGKMALFRALWEKRDKLVGKRLTVRFAYITEYGKPFHGYVTNDIRNMYKLLE